MVALLIWVAGLSMPLTRRPRLFCGAAGRTPFARFPGQFEDSNLSGVGHWHLTPLPNEPA